MRRDGAPEAVIHERALGILRSAVVLAHDRVVAELPDFPAFVLRNGMEPRSSSMPALRYGVPLFILTGCLSFYAFLHDGTWSHTSVVDLIAIATAATWAICLFLLVLFLVDRAVGVPRSVPFIQWFVLVVLLSAPRLGYRFIKARVRRYRIAAVGDHIS